MNYLSYAVGTNNIFYWKYLYKEKLFWRNISIVSATLTHTYQNTWHYVANCVYLHNRYMSKWFHYLLCFWKRYLHSCLSLLTDKQIVLLSDIPLFYIEYPTMHKVHMHACAIQQLLYGCAYVREIIYSLKLLDYPPLHTHKPYNNLHLFYGSLWTNNICCQYGTYQTG